MEIFLVTTEIIYIFLCVYMVIYFVERFLKDDNFNSYKDLTILDIILIILFFPDTLSLLIVLLIATICSFISFTKIWEKLNSKIFKED